MRIFAALLFFVSIAASAQFMSETVRMETPEYVRFFHKRFANWYSKNIFDFASIGPEEAALFKTAVEKLDRFGIRRDQIFFRAFGYEALTIGSETGPYAFSFINFANDSALDSALKKVAGKHGVDLKDWNIGTHLGATVFSSKTEFALKIFTDELEKLTADLRVKDVIGSKKGSGVVTVLFRDKKQVGLSLLEGNVRTNKICSVAVDHSQIDRVSTSQGEVFY